MKRILTLFAVVFLTGTLAFSQSLEGRWTGSLFETSTEGDDVMSMTADYTYTFTGNTYNLFMDTTVDMGIPDVPPFQVLVTIVGTWTREGDVLTLVPARKPKPKAELRADGMPGILRAIIANPIKKDLVKELQDTESYEILILTDTALTLKELPSAKDLKDPDFESAVLSMERK